MNVLQQLVDDTRIVYAYIFPLKSSKNYRSRRILML